MRRADHRRQIAAELAWIANIQNQEVEQIIAQPAGFVEPDGRNAQPLLPDFRGGGIVAAMRGAADVALMGADDGPEQTPLAVKDRHEGGEIRQMTAAVIRIVEQNDVAAPDILKSLLDGERCPWQRADVNRDVVRLRDQAAPGIAYRQRKIAAGIEDLRIGSAKHGFAHFLHDRTQPVLDDGPRDGIDLDGHAAPAEEIL